MKRNWIYIICIGMMMQSCFFIFDDKKTKGNLSTTDSLVARVSKDRVTHIDSLKEQIDYLYKKIDSIKKESTPTIKEFFSGATINTKNVPPQHVVEFAKTLVGTPYRYAS
ncbi:MAG: hypothetical protein ACXWV9_05865, partial [Flavisolibacter sp.]